MIWLCAVFHGCNNWSYTISSNFHVVIMANGHVQNCDPDFRFPPFSTSSWLPDKKKFQALAEMRHSLKPPLGLNQTVKMISTVSTEVTIYKLNFTKISTVILPFDRCKSVTKTQFPFENSWPAGGVIYFLLHQIWPQQDHSHLEPAGPRYLDLTIYRRWGRSWRLNPWSRQRRKGSSATSCRRRKTMMTSPWRALTTSPETTPCASSRRPTGAACRSLRAPLAVMGGGSTSEHSVRLAKKL